jgi:membrane fusion protein (multidrug efflux system)
MRPGQPVKIRIDAFPDRAFRGRLDSLAAATQSRFSLLPADNASSNFVKVVQRLPVRIRLLPPHADEPPLRAGVTASVSIDTGRQRRLGDITTYLSGLVIGSSAQGLGP